ncbi:unnamed protein product [Rotaria sp. Silwood2]|nr:unnamed protein product [Rotaria sp. Silwood2]CAF4119539.1 unnamed protein product [Rotaria sp. Silwood2]
MPFFIIFLQSLLMNYEDWPKSTVTEQKSSEDLSLFLGKSQGRPAWHYVIVPQHNFTIVQALKGNSTVNVTDLGRIVQYRNNRDEIKNMSGWGDNPPRIIQNWLSAHYSLAAVDENINLTYTNDDIRLCTMQRTIPEQLIGVQFHYFSSERFHYIKLIEDLPSSLARRGGIRSYDRIIFLNGINIENDNLAQFDRRFKSQRHLPVQMLVCSPATYDHYKANKMSFSCDLPSVQRLKPIYATSTSNSHTDIPTVRFDNETFYAVQWESSNIISTVPQSAVFKSPEFTNINDICIIEIENEQYRKGKIIFRGSQDECDTLNTSLRSSTINHVFKMIANLFVGKTSNISGLTNGNGLGSLDETATTSSQKLQAGTESKEITAHNINIATQMNSIIENHQDIPNGSHAILEDLPNELFYYIFTLIDIQDLYKAFWGLNSRLNNIFQFCQNLSLVFDDKVDPVLMKFYAPYVTRLVVQTSTYCDFNQFPNLRVLILCIENSRQLSQIHPDTIPNLTHLSFLWASQFTLPEKLTQQIFSNEFPLLGYVNLGRIKESISDSWIMSSHLRFVSILSCRPMFIPVILAACPNLDHLQVHVICDDNTATSSSQVNHPLRRLTLWSDSNELPFDIIDKILIYTPNVEHLYLQTIYSKSLIDLAQSLINRLPNLSQFDCYIQEMLGKDERIHDLTNLHQVHPCFNRIQSIEKEDTFRIFVTK